MQKGIALVRRRNALRGMAAVGLLGVGVGAVGGAGLASRWPLGPNWVERDLEFNLDLASPYVITYEGTYPPKKDIDSDGIVITEYAGSRVYHPVDACWYLFPQLHSYEADGDKARLESVLNTTQHLLDGAEEHELPREVGESKTDVSTWFPYHFEHRPGGLENGPPWYSGMAQGMMLSHLVRLYEVTGEQEWLDHAHLVFNSFRHYRNGDEANEGPWFVSFVDRDDRRFTTFEEYPSRNPDQLSSVVNGNVYAMWGVYDYLRVTEDRYAGKILGRAISSLIESFEDYRAPGNPSLYGLSPWSHVVWFNPESYHNGVVSILRRTADFCGDEQLRAQADLLAEDSSAE
ncbi:D-glucuronyl C5-epimerase family protein [Brachybacterium tyrofermentans]|uniref:D-glucuronyl C5-epimerase family protein n=1 Tax=Brachybacterium tyrofermentans TaxID=47848 RepID=A0ABW0FBY0_9MICO